MANPTGEQFELARGNARAVVTEIGAGLRAFDVGGVPYVESFDVDDAPPKGAGQVLLPWPNRTEGARWSFDGQTQRLEVTEPERGNAIHGLVRHRQWRLVEHAESTITMEIDIDDEPGWPVPLRAAISYELAPRALTITHEIHNVGESSVGVGVGAHPYFRIGDAPTDEVTLTVPGSRVRPFDDSRALPYGDEREVAGTEYDFRAGKSLAGADLDVAFGGLEPADGGMYRHVLTHQRERLEVWAGPDFRWVQVFTPAELTGRGRAVAIEPMTCPADALNSGTDLIALAPDESWQGSWGIRVF